MSEERKLSIYIAEFPNREDVSTRYHAALFLVDEGHEDPMVVQHLHYNDHANDLMDELQGLIRVVPNVRHGLKDKFSLEALHTYPIIGGYEADILPMWNHILKHSVEVKSQQLLFDYHDRHLPHANNCRSGVVSALASIGIGFESEYFASEAGTRASRITVSYVFSCEAGSMPITKSREENAKLTAELQPPWEQEGSLDLAGLREFVKN